MCPSRTKDKKEIVIFIQLDPSSPVGFQRRWRRSAGWLSARRRWGHGRSQDEYSLRPLLQPISTLQHENPLQQKVAARLNLVIERRLGVFLSPAYPPNSDPVFVPPLVVFKPPCRTLWQLLLRPQAACFCPSHFHFWRVCMWKPWPLVSSAIYIGEDNADLFLKRSAASLRSPWLDLTVRLEHDAGSSQFQKQRTPLANSFSEPCARNPPWRLLVSHPYIHIAIPSSFPNHRAIVGSSIAYQ